MYTYRSLIRKQQKHFKEKKKHSTFFRCSNLSYTLFYDSAVFKHIFRLLFDIPPEFNINMNY